MSEALAIGLLMALTTKQRNRLPRSAFLDPKNRRFPVPTKAQARKAGIGETQRVNTLRNARARAAQHQARGVKQVTPKMVGRAVKKRGAGQVQSVLKPRYASKRSRSSGGRKRRR